MLNAIKECPNKDVSAALAAVRLDDGLAGMRRGFERAVLFLLPTNPIKKRNEKNNKRSAATISAVNGPTGQGKGKHSGKKTTFKVSTGSTGVELRHYKNSEFKKLSISQQTELTAHMKANDNYTGSWTGKYPGANAGDPNGDKGRYITQAQVASLLTEHDARKQKKANEKEELVNETRTEFQALLQPRVEASSVANSVASRVKKHASSGEVTAAAADADVEDNNEDKAEVAADNLKTRFGDQFAKLGFKSKWKKKKSG